MVVISIMGVLGTMIFWSLGSSRDAEKLANAQKDLVASLRSAQNNALAGASGGSTYLFSFSPPSGITVNDFGKICFFNPNVDVLTIKCSGDVPYNFNAGYKEIILTGLTGQRTVRIEGSGIFVKNIYAL